LKKQQNSRSPEVLLFFLSLRHRPPILLFAHYICNQDIITHPAPKEQLQILTEKNNKKPC